MRIILDTNVLISGLLTRSGNPASILSAVIAGSVTVCWDQRIFDEYQKVVLRPKFTIDPMEVARMLEAIRAGEFVIGCQPLAVPLPDRDDEMFLEAAIASRADYLVTGNIKHYPPDRRQGVKVVTPVQFVELRRKSEP